MLSLIFPFSVIVKDDEGREQLSRALSLCFLNGGLPQGTPISPLITNVMMIPIDHRLSNSLRNFEKERFVYTRYADDLLISCKHDFDPGKVQAFVVDTLREFNAPFSIKPEKTRYGSSAGRNWNLGVMLNKDNQITIGHKKKKYFKAMLDNYIRIKKSGQSWELHDVQVLSGLISYYRMIERDYIDYILSTYNILGVSIDGYIIEKARIKGGGFSDSDHYGILLAKNEAGHYVTWQFHLDDGFPMAYWGHYFNQNYDAALSDFNVGE